MPSYADMTWTKWIAASASKSSKRMLSLLVVFSCGSASDALACGMYRSGIAISSWSGSVLPNGVRGVHPPHRAPTATSACMVREHQLSYRVEPSTASNAATAATTATAPQAESVGCVTQSHDEVKAWVRSNTGVLLRSRGGFNDAVYQEMLAALRPLTLSPPLNTVQSVLIIQMTTRRSWEWCWSSLRKWPRRAVP